MGRLEELLLTASQNLVNQNLDEAIRNFNHALIIDSKNKFALSSLGLIYYDKGQYKEAEDLYKQALKIDPENITIKNRLAETYILQRKFDEAIQEQTKILITHPDNIRARTGLGNSYKGMKKYDNAIKEYLTAIKPHLKTTANLGWTHLFSTKRYDKKIQVQERLIEKCNIIQAYCGLMEIYREKNEFTQSIKYLVQLKLFEIKDSIFNFLYFIKP